MNNRFQFQNQFYYKLERTVSTLNIINYEILKLDFSPLSHKNRFQLSFTIIDIPNSKLIVTTPIHTSTRVHNQLRDFKKLINFNLLFHNHRFSSQSKNNADSIRHNINVTLSLDICDQDMSINKPKSGIIYAAE